MTRHRFQHPAALLTTEGMPLARIVAAQHFDDGAISQHVMNPCLFLIGWIEMQSRVGGWLCVSRKKRSMARCQLRRQLQLAIAPRH
jgi:hypothetical protein